MKIPVHMFAFAAEGDRSKVRMVNIPDDEYMESAGVPIQVLEYVFKYGQNEYQPLRNFPSVSVGDAAEFDGKYYMCAPMGWDEMSKDEFDKLVPPTAMYSYQKSIKNSIKSV